MTWLNGNHQSSPYTRNGLTLAQTLTTPQNLMHQDLSAHLWEGAVADVLKTSLECQAKGLLGAQGQAHCGAPIF